MASEKTVLYFGIAPTTSSDFLNGFAHERGLAVQKEQTPDEVCALLNRTFPAGVVVGAGEDITDLVDLIGTLKGDPFTGIVPVVALLSMDASDLATDLRTAGADDMIREGLSDKERLLRLEQVLRRTVRDVSVHPTTRIPGANPIARDMQRRLNAGGQVAVCCADLDHFKEFNDRYGYALGDGVIRMLSRILRDVVRGLAVGGFVGHIGGGDFIFNLPVDDLEAMCEEIIQLFDELIPYQYTEEDRKAGFLLGKDRRGNIHRIHIMALSIGVVTNQVQSFDHIGQISELAAEMKSYAKSLPGSKHVVDRRRQLPTLLTASADQEESLVLTDSPAYASTTN